MKGQDRALTMVAEDGAQVDEITDYQNRRYLGAAEAHYRLYEFSLVSRNPAVKALSIHLEGEDRIAFLPSHMEAALQRTSELQRYFNRPLGPEFDPLTFLDYYELFREEKSPSAASIPHPDGRHHLILRSRRDIVTRINWVFNKL